MKHLHRNKHTKNGVTLVELLVVVTILMMLAAFAIPAVRPLTEGRRIREAARAIDVFLTQAKTRSITIQRPVGVVLDRMTQGDLGDPYDDTDDTLTYQEDACNILRIVEIPPPYAGDLADSRVRIQNWTTLVNGGTPPPDRFPHPNPQFANQIVLKIAVQLNTLRDGLLRRGDRVQFGFQGPLYTIVNDTYDDDVSDDGADFPVDTDDYLVFSGGSDSDSDGFIDNYILTVVAPVTGVGGVAWPLTNGVYSGVPGPTPDPTARYSGRLLWSADTTFQFYRQPQPAPIAPLRLPKDTVIDLGDSGYTPNATTTDVFGNVSGGYRGPMILFAPNGAIASVYHWAGGNYGPAAVMDPVFLMVGKWERTGGNSAGASLADDQLHNWQDATNLWIAIGPQSGFVTAAEVYAPNTNAVGVAVPASISESRQYARQAQISKGALQE